MRSYLKKLRSGFYRGPQNMGALKVPRFVGYQTATMTALYWLNYRVNTQLTLAGRVMILMGLLTMAYCMLDPYELPMSYMAFSLVVVYVINMLVGYIFRPRLKVMRVIPGRVICGATVPVKYTVVSESRMPCWDVKLDAIQYGGCKHGATVVIPWVKAGYAQHMSSCMEFKNRGSYRIPNVFAESSFPFGLWKWGVWGEGSREVRVWPRPIDINAMEIDFLAGDENVGFFDSNVGAGMEFAACREFRFGDNPKHIHWPSWARTMTPIVREMCNEGRPTLSVFFDSCHAVNLLTKYKDIQPDFEAAVCLLAGVSLYMKRRKFCIRNLVVNDELEVFKDDEPEIIHERILERCCDIQDVRKVAPVKLSDYMIDCIGATKGLVMILQNWDDSRQEAVKKAMEAGLSVKVILLGRKKPTNGPPGAFVRYGDLASGIVAKL